MQGVLGWGTCPEESCGSVCECRCHRTQPVLRRSIASGIMCCPAHVLYWISQTIQGNFIFLQCNAISADKRSHFKRVMCTYDTNEK